MGQHQAKPLPGDSGISPASDPGPRLPSQSFGPMYAHSPLAFSASSSLPPNSPLSPLSAPLPSPSACLLPTSPLPTSTHTSMPLPANLPAAASSLSKGKNLVRKLSTKSRARPSTAPSVSAPLVSASVKARKTLGEDMKAFEQLVEMAEARSGLDRRPSHTASQSMDSTFPSTTSRPKAARQWQEDVSTTTATAFPTSVAVVTPRISPTTPKMTRPQLLRQGSAGSRSPTRAVSIKSARRAEREWRAKIAALSASASASGGPERSRRRSGQVELRGGPVPPRRTPARTPTADSVTSTPAPSTPGDELVTPPHLTITSPGLTTSHQDAHETPFGKGVGAKSLASRRSFETLGFHHFVPTSSAVEEHERDRKVSVPNSVASSFYFDRSSRISTRPSSLTLNMILDVSPEEDEAALAVDNGDGNETGGSRGSKGKERAQVTPRRIIISSLDQFDSPGPLRTPLPKNEPPHTPSLSTLCRAASLASSSSSVAKRSSDSYVLASPASIRSAKGYSLPIPTPAPLPPPSLDRAPRCPPLKSTGVTLDFLRLPSSLATPIRSRAPPREDAPTPCSPTTAYILSTPAENISFEDVLMATPPRKDLHPYASKLSLSPEKVNAAQSAVSRGRDKSVPSLPPTKFSPFSSTINLPRPAPSAPGASALVPIRDYRPATAAPWVTVAKSRPPLGPATRLVLPSKRDSVLPGSTMKKQVLGPPRKVKGLRGADLTPGMQDGNRPPKSGMPMSELERWLAGTSVTSS